MQISDKNYLVVQGNELINAKYKLTSGEMRLLYVLMSKIKPDDKNFMTYEIPVKDFAKLLDVKRKDLHKYIDDVSTRFLERMLTLPDPDDPNGFVKYSWANRFDYKPKEGWFKVRLNPEIKPALLDLRNKYTKAELKYLLQFKSFYTQRIYWLLKQYEKIGTRKISIDEIKRSLDVEKRYVMYGHLKARIILPAQKELKRKSDIYFKFEEIKAGRKVKEIQFKIFKNTKNLSEQNQQKFDWMKEIDDHAEQMSAYLETLKTLDPQKKKTVEKEIDEMVLKTPGLSRERAIEIYFTTR